MAPCSSGMRRKSGAGESEAAFQRFPSTGAVPVREQLSSNRTTVLPYESAPWSISAVNGAIYLSPPCIKASSAPRPRCPRNLCSGQPDAVRRTPCGPTEFAPSRRRKCARRSLSQAHSAMRRADRGNRSGNELFSGKCGSRNRDADHAIAVTATRSPPALQGPARTRRVFKNPAGTKLYDKQNISRVGPSDRAPHLRAR